MFRSIAGRNEYRIEEVALSDEAIACYTALRIIYDEKELYHCKNDKSQTIKLSPADMLQALGYDTKTKRLQREKESMKKGLAILTDNNVVNSKKEGNSYLVDMTNLYLALNRGGDLTFNVPLEYIRLIIEQKNPLPLLRHYLLLCSTINVMGKHFGSHKIDWFTEQLGLTEKTIRNHRKTFAELEIIVFSSNRNGMSDDGTFINLPKLYTMPNCKDEANELREQQIEKLNQDLAKAKRKAEREQRKKQKQYNKQCCEYVNPFGTISPFPASNEEQKEQPINNIISMDLGSFDMWNNAIETPF